jgi:hypothetical protein
MEKVTIEQAAVELNVSQATLRSWMRHSYINIGIADKKDGSSRWCYTIYRKLLDDYKGKPREKVEGDNGI